MSSFSFPERPATEIIGALAQVGIAALKLEDLANPSADLVCTLYSNFLAFADPLGEESDIQIAFGALELLDNPDHYVDAIRTFNLYRKIKGMLASIRFGSFNLRDLIKPDTKRTLQILSTIVNFIYYRLQVNKLILDHEVARQMEEPTVQQLDAEVKDLRQIIQNYNKQQMSLKTMAKALKEKTDAINDKISQADFELVKNAQENSKLSSKIVQSPDKLQRALEEKKSYRTEVKNSERSAMQSVQEKTSTLEVYSKVNSAKTLEKDVKALKVKLSDERVSIMAVEAKLVEKQGKAKQAEELIKAKLNTVKAEMEWKLQCLEPRERKAEAMVTKHYLFDIRVSVPLKSLMLIRTNLFQFWT
ncbi:kinetochore protein NUF2 homolog [Musa acuminata AAA Group]|uniref:kinetochore protein NUF2 homolog n=1 Tax=Musa acuminata AAA Group TaxID=214697 RepID=UPI0031DB91DC